VTNADISLPAAFVVHTLEAFGERGPAWLEKLPQLVAELAEQWHFSLTGDSFQLSYDYVAAVRRRDGTEAVLKIGVPRAELRRGITALELYAGDGACRLLAADDARSAMLLERIRPGQMLSESARSDDAAATRIGASVMRRLWCRPP
jgi:streptomycin 6-kinase